MMGHPSVSLMNGILKEPLQEDGFQGDVTSNIKTIKSIPLQLKVTSAKFDVRGWLFALFRI
jgi:NAD-dependent DNA ligase